MFQKIIVIKGDSHGQQLVFKVLTDYLFNQRQLTCRHYSVLNSEHSSRSPRVLADLPSLSTVRYLVSLDFQPFLLLKVSVSGNILAFPPPEVVAT